MKIVPKEYVTRESRLNPASHAIVCFNADGYKCRLTIIYGDLWRSSPSSAPCWLLMLHLQICHRVSDVGGAVFAMAFGLERGVVSHAGADEQCAHAESVAKGNVGV